MSAPVALTTKRLLLRPWRATDRPAFAALNADPRVMEWFPKVLTRAESDAQIDEFQRHIEAHGWGFWAVEVAGGRDCIGLVGLGPTDDTVPASPAVEVAWCLAAAHWGRGYAPEAAIAALRFGFETLELDEIIALTSAGNLRSRRVMDKIGMTRDPNDDFDNQLVKKGSPRRPFVIYRLTQTAFCNRRPHNR